MFNIIIINVYLLFFTCHTITFKAITILLETNFMMENIEDFLINEIFDEDSSDDDDEKEELLRLVLNNLQGKKIYR